MPGQMARLRRASLLLALGVTTWAFTLRPLLSTASGARAPAWSHWWCSPAALSSAAHTVRASGLMAGLITAFEVHWPHFLPLLLASGTLVYLWRANTRYRIIERRQNPLLDGEPPM